MRQRLGGRNEFGILGLIAVEMGYETELSIAVVGRKPGLQETLMASGERTRLCNHSDAIVI